MYIFMVLLVIFFGESLAIYAEIFSSKEASLNYQFSWLLFSKGLGIMIIGCVLLLAGYIMGYRVFKNIWIVSAISIASILITEPILNYLIFQQLPTKGALAGLVLGVIGLALSIFF